MNNLFSQKNRYRSLIGLGMSIFILAGIYGFFLQSTVRSGMEQDAVKNEITDLQKSISDAEITYGEAVGGVSRDEAAAAGFVAAEESVFVSRKAPTTLVSYNTSE